MAGSSVAAVVREVVSHFPQIGVCAAFAYGSGVFSQRNHRKAEENMLDIVMVTDKTREWHEENLNVHRSHYSALGYLGAKPIAALQRRFGAGMYYNTLVHVGGRLVKYGVIDRADLQRDLRDWETLYLSGRLHKPVLFVHGPSQDKGLHADLQQNLQHALSTALLLLPESFSAEEFFVAIAGISYAGDFRMTVGEDRQKVTNIVVPNMSLFEELYGPCVAAQKGLHRAEGSGGFAQDLSVQRRLQLLESLPRNLLVQMEDRGSTDLGELAKSPKLCASSVQDGMVAIVKQSSLSQAVKGVLTAGLFKAVRYGGQKLGKMIQSMR